LTSVSATDAANLVTLCYLGGELLAYQTAMLTASGRYALTTLYRGAYDSAISDHAAGTEFAVLDGSVGRFSYPNNLIGQTIYLKFASTNIVGGGLQALASLPAYTYVIRGSGQASSIIVSGSFSGRPTANLVLQSFVCPDSVAVPAGFTGSRATAGTAATATADFNIQKNGTDIGTMSFAQATTTATFTASMGTVFVPGDVLTIVAPSMPDPTISNIAWTIVGIAQ
jgi:hypothetical protein